jgi:nitrous oxidase accessory protein NosD
MRIPPHERLTVAQHISRNLWTIAILVTVNDAFAQTTRPVDCSAGETIAAAVATAKPGDTLAVRGICKETVIIPAEAARITLDGQGVATIAHPTGMTTPGPAAHVVYIRGRGITVSGFRILGGVDGVHLSGPAHAVIHGNVISGNKGRGVHVDKASVAQIYDNVIERNAGGGIHITESSMARIGFLIPPQPQLQPNQVKNNGGYGIFVERGSTARIVGNRVEANDGPGVIVDRSSEADVAANTIGANSGDAVLVTRNSGVNFSSEREGPTDGPNSTDPASNNRGVAVRCEIGGYVAGPIGTLSGTAGIKAFDRSCVDRVTKR